MVKGKPRVRVQGAARQRAVGAFAAETDHRELVVYGLVARALQLAAQVVVDEGGLAAGEGAEDGDHGPPGHPRGDGLVVFQQSQPVGNLIQPPE
jgi:hypothetical protein